MKQRAFVMVVLMAVAVVGVWAQQANNPPVVALPDQATAVKFAEKVLAKIYGENQIRSERPFSAELIDGIWHITGTFYCKDKYGKVIMGGCVGGVAMADIRQSDGRVLKTGHTK